MTMSTTRTDSRRPRASGWSVRRESGSVGRLVKTGGRLIKPGRGYWLLLAEGHLTRRLFGTMLGRSARLPVPSRREEVPIITSVLLVVLGTAVTLSASACRVSPTAPRQVNLSGIWTGTGSDTQGAAILKWALTQTGNTVLGSAISRPADPTDGTYASCHKNKIGTLSGTVSGTTLTLTMFFPAGSDAEPTPMCSVTVDAAAPSITVARITGAYSGADSCEGPFADGILAMVRQP